MGGVPTGGWWRANGNEMEATIETSKQGTKVLIVPYQGNQFDAAIEAAERYFNLEGDSTVTVIALPVGLCNDTRGMQVTQFFEISER